MTTEDGEYALRNRNDWGGRPSVAEPSGDGYDGTTSESESAGDAGERGDVPAPDGGRSTGSAATGSRNGETGEPGETSEPVETRETGDTGGSDACGCGPGSCGSGDDGEV
jgi:hypothetical protein